MIAIPEIIYINNTAAPGYFPVPLYYFADISRIVVIKSRVSMDIIMTYFTTGIAIIPGWCS